jgi:transcriptional regulator with XRE-family HTH domain
MLRRRVGAELRRLRENRGAHLAEVAAQLQWSESKLSRVETGHMSIRPGDLDRILDLYRVDTDERAHLRAIAAKARQRAWWEAYGYGLPDAYETFIGFEAEAARILAYEAQLIFGLLQTPEYARAVMQAEGTADDIASRRVAVRMARQAVLAREPPPQLHVVLDEAALRRPIGGQGIMRRQLRRLVDAAEQPGITIQVLPFEAGGHPGLAGSFVILEFANESDGPLVYSEGATGGVLRAKNSDLQNYHVRFATLAATALSEDLSVQFIAAAAHGK